MKPSGHEDFYLGYFKIMNYVFLLVMELYCFRSVTQILICCIFIFSSMYFFESAPLTHGLLTSMFSFQVFRDFSVIFPLLISGLIPLWSENSFCIIQFF